AIRKRQARPKYPVLGPRSATRRSEHGPDRTLAARQQVTGPLDVPRPRADGGYVVADGQLAAGLDECVIELGPQERVVDRLCDVGVAEPVEKRCHQLLLRLSSLVLDDEADVQGVSVGRVA